MEAARLKTLLRFALRTGRVVFGPTGAKVKGARHPGGVLFVAADGKAERREQMERWAARENVTVCSDLSAADLAEVAGRPVSVLYVYDRSLARSLGNELGGKREI